MEINDDPYIQQYNIIPFRCRKMASFKLNHNNYNIICDKQDSKLYAFAYFCMFFLQMHI